MTSPLTEIPVIVPSQPLQQWQILEMQGSLEARTDDGKLDNITLGQLTIKTDKQRRAELVVGKQSCDGKQIDIKKPLLVLKKTKNSKTGEVEYEIEAIVRDKLLFRTRPTPRKILCNA
jgi:chromosome transmission fidelity protein 8